MHPYLANLKPETATKKEALFDYIQQAWFKIPLTPQQQMVLFAAIWGDDALFQSLSTQCPIQFQDHLCLETASFSGHVNIAQTYLDQMPADFYHLRSIFTSIERGKLDVLKLLLNNVYRDNHIRSCLEHCLAPLPDRNQPHYVQAAQLILEKNISVSFYQFADMLNWQRTEMAVLLMPHVAWQKHGTIEQQLEESLGRSGHLTWAEVQTRIAQNDLDQNTQIVTKKPPTPRL